MEIGLVTNGIDFRNYSYANYTQNLVHWLGVLAPELGLTAVHHEKMDHEVYRRLPEVILPRRTFSPLRPPWGLDRAKNRLSSVRVDLLHDLTSSLAMVWRAPYRKVLTIHDTTSLIFPKLCPRGRVAWKLLGRTLVRRVDHILAVSECTKRDVVRHFGVSPSKITVTHEAAGSQFRELPPERIADFRARHSLAGPFFLYLGVLQPRKNIPVLIRAFARARAQGLQHRLVIAGPKGWDYDDIFTLTRQLALDEAVKFTGPLSAEDVPLAYNAAEAFVFPSLYEGFGFPPLEAMSCGTPVITSHTSSLPEVVGDAGLMVAPEDVAGLAEQMLRVAHDADLRARMRRDGFRQAARFSWERCAAETLAVYRTVLGTLSTA